MKLLLHVNCLYLVLASTTSTADQFYFIIDSFSFVFQIFRLDEGRKSPVDLDENMSSTIHGVVYTISHYHVTGKSKSRVYVSYSLKVMKSLQLLPGPEGDGSITASFITCFSRHAVANIVSDNCTHSSVRAVVKKSIRFVQLF